jgi:ubiquinone/menaquinone biosynthesis C-methylase UbiE
MEIFDRIKHNNQDKINQFHWSRIEAINNILLNKGYTDNIIDVGGGMNTFEQATHIIDISSKNPNIYKVDIDFERFPFEDKFFNFAYCRHTLEDIQNPQHAFNEIVRTSKQAYIETPSPLIELMRGVDPSAMTSRGYIQHRYFVFSDLEDNSLHFIPKYPIIETLTFNDEFFKKMVYLANNYPIYWNNYYMYDEVNKPKIVLYRHGVNFEAGKINEFLYNGIFKSIEYTNKYFGHLVKI